MFAENRYFCSLLMCAALASAVVTTGCAARVGVGYRVYDPGYRDYHAWNDGEIVYYNRWATENHRDPHRDFRRLRREDQSEYWNWRHGQR